MFISAYFVHASFIFQNQSQLCMALQILSPPLFVSVPLVCTDAFRPVTTEPSLGWLTDHLPSHHLPPWIRSFDLFRHRRIAIVSWGVHGLFFLEVCS